MKTVISYFVFVLCSVSLYGQSAGLSMDTIRIKEVIIKTTPVNNLNSIYKTTVLDSSVLEKNCFNESLTQVLEENSAVFIKNYGAGGLATSSFRGTGPGHTQVEWNDITIDNPMTGQFDLSLIPAAFIDRIDILYGGSSMLLNSGGLGGIINLETRPDWGNRLSVLVNPSVGSFRNYSGLVKIKAGTVDFQTVTKIMGQSAENDFPFVNTSMGSNYVKELRTNNQLRQKGFIQELYYRKAGGILSAKLWYQSCYRNLPAPVISLPSGTGEHQTDESLRTVIGYESTGHRNTFNLTAAMVSDNLNYVNELASINSRNKSYDLFLKGNLATTIAKKTRLKFDFRNELSIINSNNYSSKKARNLLSAGVAAETTFSDRFFSGILARETLLDNKPMIPDFSAGTRFRIVPGDEYFVSANVSKNSKVPSLNDMYWNPGGNPDLKSETGFAFELSLNAKKSIGKAVNVRSDITLYHNIIHNMIQWRPGSYSYWEAGNIGNIRTSGIESELGLLYRAADLSINMNAAYTLTIASTVNDISAGRQLIYVPANRFNASLKIDWKNMYAVLNEDYTGRRFLEPDNSSYLPAYFINNLDAGIKFRSGDVQCMAGCSVNNIFNVDYQNIAWYPMPGRAFLVSVVFQFKK